MVVNKDWTGNKNSVMACTGVKSKYSTREEYDYYATEPKAALELLRVEPNLNNIWECACGEGHLAKVFAVAGKLACATDIVYRGYAWQDTCVDFLKYEDNWNLKQDIVTNPPYKYAKEFVEKALSLVAEGYKVCMLLRIQFLESKQRQELFKKYPPIRIWVFSNRIKCAKNGDFDNTPSSAQCYAWFVWQKGFEGYPIVRWID